MRIINYKTYVKPSYFLKLEQGETRVRIVSEGILCYEHGVLLRNGKYVPLGLCSENKHCKQCQRGNDPNLRYKWVVYLPKTGEVKVMAVGIKVGDEICVIGKKEEALTFEVVITKNGFGKDVSYKVEKVTPTKVDAETALIIKENRDYLFNRYLNS